MWLHAIPNGGFRNAREAARLKAEGVTPGVADLLLPWPKIDSKGIIVYCGLYIEVKTPSKSSVLSDAQKKFQAHCPKARYKHIVVRNAMDGINAIKDYMGIS